MQVWSAVKTSPARRLVCAAVSLACCSTPAVHASAFAIQEQSGTYLGTAFAGTAVVAEDPSTIFYNPAGLTQLRGFQVALVASGIDLGSRFSNSGSQAAFGQQLGSEGDDAGGFNFVPSAYASARLSDRWVAGIGIGAPFGLSLDYQRDWIGRFQALTSEIETRNFNPALAYEVHRGVSVGIGLNYQRLKSKLTNSVNLSGVIAQGIQQGVASGAVPPAVATGVIQDTQGLEATAIVRGDDDAFGYNVGVRWEVGPATVLGLAYRSSVDYDVDGNVRFELPTVTNPLGSTIVGAASSVGGPLANGPVSVQLELPDSASLSLGQSVGPKARLLFDVAWTGWSTVQELRVVRTSGATLSAAPQNWRDSWRFSAGGSYQLTQTLLVRSGIMYDETPVPDSTRAPRLADADRTLVAIGARWLITPSAVLDAGYARLFSSGASVTQDGGNAVASGAIVGRQRSDANIISTQFTYRF